mmetsp:Transcript_91515/g.158397  ORF Transcript_91515/g.158397 Transcript_91515/m.158397 type:complete len:207 (-) Transcript_91515:147-767(-)
MMLGCAAPISKSKIQGLSRNQKALKTLHESRERLIEWDEIKVRSRLSKDLSTGNQIIDCRWNARLGIKTIQIPQWAILTAGATAAAAAAVFADADPLEALAAAGIEIDALPVEAAAFAAIAAAVKVLQERFPDLAFPFATAATRESSFNNVLVIDAVSKFYLNAEGRIYRHVIDNVSLRLNDQPLRVPDVEALLSVARLQPAFARC